MDQAEAAFLKALELEPRLNAAYVALGQLYASSGKLDKALTKLNEATANNPNDVGALMLSAIIYQMQGDTAKAQVNYEKLLEIKPDFAPAANNLAYIYSSQGGDLEKAFQLAMKAHEAAPDDPGISDTLGWILFKRGDYQWALGLLQESAEKLPDNAEVQYHLGMVQYKLDNANDAKEILAKALELDKNFAGADEARQTLEKIR